MIRVVVAVVLSSALLGAALPSAERADRERNAALATAELEAIADRAARLAAENDPVAPGRTPAAITVSIDVPQPTFADGGRVRIRRDELRWEPIDGPNRSVGLPVELRVESSIVLTDRARIRLSLRRIDGDAVVVARPLDPSV
ncbi:DUF7311 family protein [Natronomonas sp.]|uniref:DUF7311 family protein n=1 Tax=Natronomonas sp. TaxID=2184060 RepID=UPI00263212B0|nr:hypothetical protein [Natronomonas sp.]